jgi:SAM-dependent methyltransferase
VKENFSCTVCGHRAFTTPFDNGTFRVHQCAACRYGVVDPIPSPAELDALYNAPLYFATHMDYDYHTITRAAIDQRVAQNDRLHYPRLAPYVKPGQTLLEIGPGGGFALKALQRRGLRVTGLETSAASCRFAAEKLEVPMINRGIEGAPADATYDVVMLNHVLEHFTDLPAGMRTLHRLCAPGGLLYVRVPDHDSYDRRSYGDSWPAYLPFHISYFSEKSLRRLLASHGFAVLDVKRYVSERLLHGAPAPLRKIARRLVAGLGLTHSFSGRTLTVVARKTA